MKGQILMQRLKIADGVTLSIIPSTKFKTNYLSINFVSPLEENTASFSALLPKVLGRATKNYPTTALLSEKLEYLYDMSVSMRNFKRGELVVTSYESDFLKNAYIPEKSEDMLTQAVGMFREIVFNSLVNDGAFDEKILESEKTDLVNAIKSLINNKNAYAKQKCTEIMCKGEKYSISELGTVENVGVITATSLYEYYTDFVKTARAEIYFIGECDENKLQKLLSETFAKIEREPLPLPETIVTGNAAEPVNNVTEEMPVNQGKLAMGFRTGIKLSDDDLVAFSFFCEVFGGSPMSKLFMNVREKLSLCYYCKALGDCFKGVMFVLSGIESENRDKSVDAIMNELRDIQNGKISQDEMEAARLSLINSYKELSDNPPALAVWYLSRALYNSFAEPSDIAKAIEKITLSDVVAAAGKVNLDTVFFLKGTSSDNGEDEE